MEGIEDFRLSRIADVNDQAEEENLYPYLVYLERVTSELSVYDKCPVAVPCFYTRTGQRGRKLLVHGYSFNDFDNTLSLFLCDYSGQEKMGSITLTDFKALIRPVISFIEDSLSGHVEEITDPSDEGYALAREIRTNRDKIDRYAVYVVTDKKRSDRFNSISEMKVDGKDLLCRIVDMDFLYAAVKEVSGPDDIEIDVREICDIDGIPAMEAFTGDTGFQSYLCIVPGTFLAESYKKYGSSLLESNVRSFLGLSGSTNKGIRQTIQEEPQLFFAFNNGITTTSTAISRDEEGRILKFENLQIVNGGQTTVSIFNEWKKKPRSVEDIYVLMKLTVAPPQIASEIVPRISQYANTQNAVKKSDLDSNNEFQKLMEYYSRNTRIPQMNGELGNKKWYYERTRNQFSQDPLNVNSPAEFKRQFDKKRKIDKLDFARYRCMISMMPDKVAKGKEDCYNKYFRPMVQEKWEEDRDFFSTSYFTETVATRILYDTIHTEIPKRDWYGERGSILATLTNYSICKLFFMLSEKDLKLNLAKIWEEQAVNDVVVRQTVSIARVFAEYMDSIQSQGMLGTQWAKQEKCWEDVKSLRVEFDPQMKNYVLSTDQYNQNYAKSKRIDRESSKARDENAIIALTPEFWTKLANWREKNVGPFSLADASLVKIAKSKGGNLNSGQIKRLRVIIQDAWDNGYRTEEVSKILSKDTSDS